MKVQHFLSGLPQSYKDIIEFYEPRTLKEAIRKAKYFYDQSKVKLDYHKTWKDKKNEKYDLRKRGFKPSSFRNQQWHPSQVEKPPARVMGEKTRDLQQVREPLQCWICGGPHMRRNFPLENESASPADNIQEVEIVGQVARAVPRIYATLEDRWTYHQSTVVEVTSNIVEQSTSILIGPGSTHSYNAPRVVEVCALRKENHSNF